MNVRIVKDYELKPYIGGYRNRGTSVIYHNARCVLVHAVVPPPVRLRSASRNGDALIRGVSESARVRGRIRVCACACPRSTQTTVERKSRWDGRPPSYCRETQTVTVSTRSQQTTREGVTQMARPDLYLDTSGDTALAPKPYFSSENLMVRTACSTGVCVFTD